jgi:hypothetical protein
LRVRQLIFHKEPGIKDELAEMNSGTEDEMAASGHGGARAGAGRKPSAERKVKRSVALSVETDAAVLAAMAPEESYSQALERLVRMAVEQRDGGGGRLTAVDLLVQALSREREAVASIYRRLGWSRQEFERVVQANRGLLGRWSVRLYVAPKVAASGRREQYITVDGMRYSAMSRDERTAVDAESGA